MVVLKVDTIDKCLEWGGEGEEGERRGRKGRGRGKEGEGTEGERKTEEKWLRGEGVTKSPI